MTPAFFTAVRPLFGGRLTAGQVDGMERIVAYAKANGYSQFVCAYALATTKHETANWMQPIREGARLYGPSYTDAQARRAVTSIFNKGIIRKNYSLPAGPYKHSYYGRGLVQITWLVNYAKLGDRIGVDLVADPDAALTWDAALPLLYLGLVEGLYTGKAIPTDVPPGTAAGNHFDNALRAAINGDVKKNGPVVDRYAEAFFTALESTFTEPCTCTCKCSNCKKEIA